MIGGRVLYFLASFCWGLSQSIMYRSGGFGGWFYLFLCIILFVVASTYLARGCLWDVLGGASCMFIWYSPPLRAWLASTLLYYLCHFNENYVIVFLFLDWVLGLGWFGCFWKLSILPPLLSTSLLGFLVFTDSLLDFSWMGLWWEVAYV